MNSQSRMDSAVSAASVAGGCATVFSAVFADECLFVDVLSAASGEACSDAHRLAPSLDRRYARLAQRRGERAETQDSERAKASGLIRFGVDGGMLEQELEVFESDRLDEMGIEAGVPAIGVCLRLFRIRSWRPG